MRAFEFSKKLISEAAGAPKTMTGAELKKGDGKYVDSIISAIRNGESFNFYIKGERVSGKIKNPRKITSTLRSIQQNDFDQDPNKIVISIETEDGDQIEARVSNIIKDEISKGEFTFNLGNIAEAIMGSAMTALFEKEGGAVSVEDAKNIGRRMYDNNGKIEGNAGKDLLSFTMTIPSRDAKAFYSFLGKETSSLSDLGVNEDKIREIEKMYSDAVTYVNNSARAKSAVDKAKADPAENRVEVLSDGGNPEKQNITKVDLEILYDGRKINLISLKAGAVKQIGQESGADFSTIERFFKSTIGFGLPNSMQDNFLPKTDPNYKEHNYKFGFRAAYDHIFQEIKSHVDGTSTYKEYDLVKSVYDGIHYHGTRGEEGVILLVLSPSAKQAYQELTLGQPLLDELRNYDLDAVKKTDGQNYIIEIYGIAKTQEAKNLDSKARLIQLRSYKQANAIRNVVEIGPLLKDLADLQKIEEKKSKEPKEQPKTEPIDNKNNEVDRIKQLAGVTAKPQTTSLQGTDFASQEDPDTNLNKK
jgi:hypothetical protein